MEEEEGYVSGISKTCHVQVLDVHHLKVVEITNLCHWQPIRY
jgi:hypothetical protein